MLECYNEEYRDLLGKGPPPGKKHQARNHLILFHQSSRSAPPANLGRLGSRRRLAACRATQLSAPAVTSASAADSGSGAVVQLAESQPINLATPRLQSLNFGAPRNEQVSHDERGMTTVSHLDAIDVRNPERVAVLMEKVG